MKRLAGTIRSLKPNVTRVEPRRHLTEGARGVAAVLAKSSCRELIGPFRKC